MAVLAYIANTLLVVLACFGVAALVPEPEQAMFGLVVLVIGAGMVVYGTIRELEIEAASGHRPHPEG